MVEDVGRWVGGWVGGYVPGTVEMAANMLMAVPSSIMPCCVGVSGWVGE